MLNCHSCSYLAPQRSSFSFLSNIQVLAVLQVFNLRRQKVAKKKLLILSLKWHCFKVCVTDVYCTVSILLDQISNQLFFQALQWSAHRLINIKDMMLKSASY
jgi:hypothetical protein